MKDHLPGPEARENISKWQAVLKELRMENIQLKNELSAIIKKDINSMLLEKAEHFQQRFVQKDQLIDLLRLDINKLLKYTDAHGRPTDKSLYDLTGNDMEKLVIEFDALKTAFSSFITEAGITV